MFSRLGRERKTEITAFRWPPFRYIVSSMDAHDSAMVEENLNELSRAFAATPDARLIEDFLRSLLTPAETADVAARWALVKELDKKTPQREIAKRLGLSLCKITRGSRELKRPDSPFGKMLSIAKTLNA